jgi:hypothetical protein
MSTALYLGIGGGVLLLIIIIVSVMMMGGKKDENKTEENEVATTSTIGESSTSTTSTDGASASTTGGASTSTTTVQETIVTPPPPTKPEWWAPTKQIEWNQYLIQPLKSNKCVDIKGASKSNEADVHLWDCHGKWNQVWQFRPHLEGKFYNSEANKCFNVWGGGVEGNKVKMYDCQNAGNTQFEYDEKQRFRLKASEVNNLCLAVDSYDNGSQLTLRTCSDDEKQKWKSPNVQ